MCEGGGGCSRHSRSTNEISIEYLFDLEPVDQQERFPFSVTICFCDNVFIINSFIAISDHRHPERLNEDWESQSRENKSLNYFTFRNCFRILSESVCV